MPRLVTIRYETVDGKNQVRLEDSDGQYVDYEIDGPKAYFVSCLHEDNEASFGSCHVDDAMARALGLMGVL